MYVAGSQRPASGAPAQNCPDQPTGLAHLQAAHVKNSRSHDIGDCLINKYNSCGNTIFIVLKSKFMTTPPGAGRVSGSFGVSFLASFACSFGASFLASFAAFSGSPCWAPRASSGSPSYWSLSRPSSGSPSWPLSWRLRDLLPGLVLRGLLVGGHRVDLHHLRLRRRALRKLRASATVACRGLSYLVL